MRELEVPGSPYIYDQSLTEPLRNLQQRVNVMRALVNKLDDLALRPILDYFRLKNTYNSNAIEGNSLTLGETQLVVREGLTITGKPLKDTLEAKNLHHALDLMDTLANHQAAPISLLDIRNLHQAILKDIDDRNAGVYRQVFVSISGSKYAPPDPAKIEAEMTGFARWLEQASQVNGPYQGLDPVILACVAHAWFVQIHPFVDGNGRTARLLLNLLLIRWGYPIAIITKEDRYRYYDTLEESQSSNLSPFVHLVAEALEESVEVYEGAHQQYLQSRQTVGDLFKQAEVKLQHEFEIYQSAMNLLKSYFRQMIEISKGFQSQGISPILVYFKEYGGLEFEKYARLKQSQSAKKTWFMKLTFVRKASSVDEKDRVCRYLFFFESASSTMATGMGEKGVSLHLAAETEAFYFERVGNLAPAEQTAHPHLREISYLPAEQSFIVLDQERKLHRMKAEAIAENFIRQVLAQMLSN
jgi:Fic family protein